VGTISSVDAMNGAYGQRSAATATESRSKCAQYLQSTKCAVSTVTTDMRRHMTAEVVRTFTPPVMMAPFVVTATRIAPQVVQKADEAVKAVTTPAYGGVVKFLASPYTRLAMGGLIAT